MQKKIFMPLFRRYQIGMDCLFHHHHHHHHHHPLSKRFTLSAAPDTLFSCFSKPTHNCRFPVRRPNSKCALWARNMSRWLSAMSRWVCYVPSQVRVLTMSAQYAKSSLRACLMCLMFSATRLPCPFSLADNHLLLSNALFSLLRTAKTLHFTVVFTGFRDFDLF